MNSDRFFWGVATASYQIEGGFDADGKGKTDWDVFSENSANTVDYSNGNVACDFYHHYKEDIKIMADLHIKAYRFSVSWARIFPNNPEEINEKGLEFYENVVNELLKYDIEPFITLFHWDMPQWVLDRGGFSNPEIVEWFGRYTDVLTKRLGKKVKYYMTFNEPQTNFNCGYIAGIFAPNYRLSERGVFSLLPNYLRCHGRANKIIRQNVQDAKVGFALCCDNFYPDNDDEELDIAVKKDFFNPCKLSSVAWFADTVLFGKVPESLMEKYYNIFSVLSQKDLDEISLPIDYFGLNLYMGLPKILDENGNLVCKKLPFGYPATNYGWQITEKSLYYECKILYERYKIPIVISENGMSSCDWVCIDGKVHDSYRIDYLQRYISSCLQAKKEGVPVIGYFVWSFMDNFEWNQGYTKRFGLVYVDFETQKRTVKDSGYWYRDLIDCKCKV